MINEIINGNQITYHFVVMDNFKCEIEVLSEALAELDIKDDSKIVTIILFHEIPGGLEAICRSTNIYWYKEYQGLKDFGYHV